VGRGQPGEWPLSDGEFEEWAASVPWQDTVSNPTNPHQYTLKRYSPDPRLFELMVLHLRERGSQELFGGTEYMYLEVGGHKYWTMMSPLEWTILVNRKEVPGGASDRVEREVEQGPRKPREDLPEVYTARYFSENLLASGVVVPVRISLIPSASLIPLSYPIEHEVRVLMPERRMYGEWPKFSPEFWRHLDDVGPEWTPGSWPPSRVGTTARPWRSAATRTSRRPNAATGRC